MRYRVNNKTALFRFSCCRELVVGVLVVVEKHRWWILSNLWDYVLHWVSGSAEAALLCLRTPVDDQVLWVQILVSRYEIVSCSSEWNISSHIWDSAMTLRRWGNGEVVSPPRNPAFPSPFSSHSAQVDNIDACSNWHATKLVCICKQLLVHTQNIRASSHTCRISWWWHRSCEVSSFKVRGAPINQASTGIGDR